MFGTLSTATIFSGVGLIGLIGILWSHISLYLTKIYGIVVVRIKIMDNPGSEACASDAIHRYIFDNFRPSPLSLKTFYGSTYFIKSHNKRIPVPFETKSAEPTIYWKGWRPMLVTFTAGNNTGPGGTKISFIRGMFNANKLIEESFLNREKLISGGTKGNRFSIKRVVGMSNKQARNQHPGEIALLTADSSRSNSYIIPDRPLIYSLDDIGERVKTNPFKTMALSKMAKQVVADAIRWKKSENWYVQKQIPWRRGLCLTGPPGTGKTSLARNLGQELNMPVWSFDLASLSNSELISNWQDAMSITPVIILLEDIDAVFHGRENITKNEDGLSFDCLLNCIDGVENSDGRLLIITTNNIQHIDNALCSNKGSGNIISRPGRIDTIVELDILDAEGLQVIANNILSDTPEYIAPLIKKCVGSTGAQFQNICATLALQLYWEKKNNDIV